MATGDVPGRPDGASAAERMRRHRARRRRGEMVVPVPVAEDQVIGWLLDTGRIAEQDSEDPHAVAMAIARVLREITAAG